MNKSETAVTISAILGKATSIIGYIAGTVALHTIVVGATDIDSEGAVAAMIFLIMVLVFCVFFNFQGNSDKETNQPF